MKALLLFLSALLFAAPAAAVGLRFGGFGDYAPDSSVPCVTEEQRAEIRAQLAATVRDLEARGLLGAPTAPQAVLFTWPLRASPDLSDAGYHGISGFVDHNPGFPGALTDYNCGIRTYDLASGYNHAGTDFFTWPFPWYKVEHDQVEIVAAADGMIIGKADGNYDRNCGFGGGSWNAVYVRHADNSVAWYGHMKTGSLTTKTIGQSVSRGEFLGVVGSSGNSTGPHLHFEVYDAQGSLLDPWAGPCNPVVHATWWQAQRPYYDSAINAVLTHSAPPVFPSCPGIETLNRRDGFAPGETLYLAAYYRDQLQGQASEYTVLDPNGGVFETWTHSSPAPHYSASYWYWYGVLPLDAVSGYWKFRVVYLGVTTEHLFWVGIPTATAAAGQGGELALRLAASNPAAGQFAFDSHLPAAGDARLEVFTVAGRRVTVLAAGPLPAGTHRVNWNTRSTSTAGAAPRGLYVVRLTLGEQTRTCKVVVLTSNAQ